MKKFYLIIILVGIMSNSYALNPKKKYLMTPDSLGLAYQSYTISTPDSARIKVWHILPTKKFKNNITLILNYGDGGNMSYWLSQAGILSQVGYSIILFDYRGFGESSDFKMNPNQLYYDEFITDLTTVIKWTKSKIDYKYLGLMSFSMGTIISTLAVQKASVDFIIGDGYVLNLQKLKRRIYKLRHNRILLPESSKNYETQLSKIQIPILVVSGKLDKFTSVSDSKIIISQKPNRELISYDGGHLQAFYKLTKNYYAQILIERISKFINEEVIKASKNQNNNDRNSVH